LPDVPTTGEAGFKTVLSDNWYGLIAPAGQAVEVEDKLRKAAISTLHSAELKKQFETQDALPSPSTPEEFTAFLPLLPYAVARLRLSPSRPKR
jgi:tripartite-type tricarboxylate transporter receptor subunit TctC